MTKAKAKPNESSGVGAGLFVGEFVVVEGGVDGSVGEGVWGVGVGVGVGNGLTNVNKGAKGCLVVSIDVK